MPPSMPKSVVKILSITLLMVGGRLAVGQQDGLQSLLQKESQGDASAGAQPEAPARQPIPSATASRQALTEAREIFNDDYAKATTPQARSAFARQLLAQAEKTPAPAERWALSTEAMRLASDAGDTNLSFETIDKTASHFAIDADEYKLEAISKLAIKCSPEAVDGLARAAIAIAKKALDAGNSAAVSRSLSLASALARKTKNRTLLAEVTTIQQSARDRERDTKERAVIEGKLAAEPSNPNVCLDAGKYFCFKAGEWDRGLPLLAKGSNTDLARLAVAEINAGKTVDATIAVADAWWEWAEKERGAAKAAGTAHAADRYATVVPKIQGLDRTRLEKRIKQVQSDSPNRGKRVALADLREESATGMQYGFMKDGTFKGKPFTCGGKQWPKGLTAMTHEQGTSIVYKLPVGAKQLVGTAGVFRPDGAGENQHPSAPITFEIVLDGHSVWQSQPLPEQNDTADFSIELYGATKLELRSKSNSGSGAWSAWLNPEIAY